MDERGKKAYAPAVSARLFPADRRQESPPISFFFVTTAFRSYGGAREGGPSGDRRYPLFRDRHHRMYLCQLSDVPQAPLAVRKNLRNGFFPLDGKESVL